jgi:hypothetical protein
VGSSVNPDEKELSMSSKLLFHLFSPQFASFVVTLPTRFNPTPSQLQGEPIPLEWIKECEVLIIEQFGRVTITDGFGASFYSDNHSASGHVVYREPERRYIIDLPLEQTPEALEWFSARCPGWAARFQQRELYLKLTTPDGIYIMRFPPSDTSSDQVA